MQDFGISQATGNCLLSILATSSSKEIYWLSYLELLIGVFKVHVHKIFTMGIEESLSSSYTTNKDSLSSQYTISLHP
jgi:hypothetical protein